jgi:hypothetical protein
MRVHTSDDLRYYQFDTFTHPDVTHAVFARHGGVSRGAFASLNMSVSVGDSLENVRANRARAFLALGREPNSIADLWQVHSADVIVADEPRGAREYLAKADALVTDRPHVSLFLRFADCVPILLFDPKRHAVGVVHAGWRGTLLKASAAAVRAMTERYGSRPRDILAGIGPSIGPCHYEVGPEVVAESRAVFNSHADELLVRVNHSIHLDLWAANARTLREAGVEQIEMSRMCTACRNDEFFSHRGERGQTGRFGALIALQ